MPIEMTDRMKRVKEKYMTFNVPRESDPYTPKKYRPYRSGDRLITLGYLRGWKKYSSAETTRLRTSYAEAEELYEAKPIICDNELLLGHLYLPEYTPEEQAEYDALADAFEMSSHTLALRGPRKDQIGLDFDKLLRLGVDGLRKEIEGKLASLDLSSGALYPDWELLRQEEFYRCCLVELDAVSDLARRYSEEADRQAEKCDEPRRGEILRLAEIMRRVPENPATSFYEAIQSVQFFLSTLFGLYPLDRPDRYLYPFYKRDTESGELTVELAQELIDNFCLFVSDRVFSRSACGFIVGGRDSAGRTVENELTYMFITALDHLQLPDPNGALAVTPDTSDELLYYCAEVLSHGTTHPAFYNDDVITASLVINYGVSPEDAVNYIHSTCAEISVIGKSKAHTTPFCIDLPRRLSHAVKSCYGANGVDEILDEFLKIIKEEVKVSAKSYLVRMMEGARIGNEAMRASLLVDDCIARGRSIYEGGERYCFIQPIFVGFGTVVDSIVAITELVFKEKRVTLSELDAIVDRNFEGDEPLRRYIVNRLPHYGNSDKGADLVAKDLAGRLLGMFEGDDIPGGRYMMPGTFTYINHATFGAQMGATYDGRVAGLSYSDGCCAVQGRDVSGPTAMIESLTSWEQSRLLGGMVVNIKFGKQGLSGEKIRNFFSVLRVFMERGGIEMQVNVVDRATLLDARENPECHGDLIVRIGGYSDYFVRLKPELMQDVIDRTDY